MDKVIKMLKEIKLPYAYSHFAERCSPRPPFICWLMPESDNFSADGKVYFRKNAVHFELYTDKKDVCLEKYIENVFDKYSVFYNKSETWIESERMYEVLYIFRMED